MTRAPASIARCAVASLEPSSITSTSRHAAVDLRLVTTSAIESSSFIAGITMETSDASAKQLLHYAIPGDGRGACASGLAETGRQLRVRGEARDRGTDRCRVGGAHEAVVSVDDELQRAAGVARGDHRLGTQERFKGDVAVVLVERRVDDGERSGVERNERLGIWRAREHDAVCDTRRRGRLLGGVPLRALADDDQPQRRWHV